MVLMRAAHFSSSASRPLCAFSQSFSRPTCYHHCWLRKLPFLTVTVELSSSPPLQHGISPRTQQSLSANFRTMYSSIVNDSLFNSADQEETLARRDNLILVSDLDCTMVDHTDPSHTALLNFNCLWAADYAYNSLLVYATGRSWQRYTELREMAPLLTPQVLILSVGTEIRVGPSLEVDTLWQNELDDGWNRGIIVEEAMKIPGLKFQEEADQGPHKVSFKLEKGILQAVQQKLSARLVERGLNVKLLCSSGIDLDVLPYRAGKGQALSYLLAKLTQEGSPHKNVVVCGDSGNDIDLFTVEKVCGVIVSNAQEELVNWHQLHGSGVRVFLASQRCAGGIVEALKQFGLGPYLSPFERFSSSYEPFYTSLEDGFVPSPGSAVKEVVELKVFITKWLSGQLPNTKEVFERLTTVIRTGAKVVYPWGLEASFAESINALRQKHGSTEGSKSYVWFDNMHVQRLHEGVFLVTWQPWEQSPGHNRRGYFASAILIAKAGTPNGVVWLHCHETLRTSS